MVRAIERRGLLDTVERVGGHLVLQAGAGYGKSVLLDQIAGVLEQTRQIVRFAPIPGEDADRFGLRLRTAYEQVGAFHLAARLMDQGRADEPWDTATPQAALIIDDADLLDDISAKRLADHLGTTRGHVRLVAAGRSLPAPLQRLELGHAVVQFGHDALAITDAEVRALLADRLQTTSAPRPLVTALIDRSAGCFAVVHALVQRAAASPEPLVALGSVLEQNAVLPALVEQCRAELSTDDREAAAILAVLPSFRASMVDTLATPGALDRLLAAGFPIWADDSGWFALPRPVAELLRGRESPPVDALRSAARAMALEGRLRLAVDVLLRCDGEEAAADLLDEFGGTAPPGFTPVDVLTATDRMADALARRPRLVLLRAMAFRSLPMVDDCRAELARAVTVARAVRDHISARQAIAEQLLLDVLDGPTPDIVGRLDVLAGELGSDETVTLARISEARGALDAWPQTQAGLAPAELHYRRAIALWTQLGDHAQCARAVRGLVVAVLLPAGRYEEAQRELRSSIHLMGATNVAGHTSALVLLGQVAAANGDPSTASAALDEAGALGRAAGLSWIESYAAWGRMHLAAQAHDGASVRRYHEEATSLLGQLAAQVTGPILLAEAVIAAVRAGDLDYAREQLAVLEGQPGTAGERNLARLAVLAHGGEPEAAIELAESIADGHLLPAGRRWHTTLLHALALGRSGAIERAEATYRVALQRATDWGVEHLPGKLDQFTCRAIERLITGGDRIAYLEPASPQFTVRVLGSFAVWRNGRLLPMVPSNATDLVKLVAAKGGKVSVDVVCDALWPESTSDAGRRRLKNVMLRAKVATAGLVERQDQTVVFSAGTELDLAEFERRTTAAMASARSDRAAARRQARSALEVAGALLPDDLYSDWASEPRLQVRRRVASLVDLVLSEPVDVASAAWLAELVTTSDPYDDGRLLRIAGLLGDNGGEALATALISQVNEIYGDGDVEGDNARHLGA